MKLALSQIKFLFSFLLSFYFAFCCHLPNAYALPTENLSPQDEIAVSSLLNKFVENHLDHPVTGEYEQFQIVSDPFANQIAVWISHGLVYASIKPSGENWPCMPDLLSAQDQVADSLHLAVDSTGNVLMTWQELPSLSIQTATKSLEDPWQIHSLTPLDENGFAPQIAEGSSGYATAAWKCYDQEQIKMRLTEIALPFSSSIENFDSWVEIGQMTDHADKFDLIEGIDTTLMKSKMRSAFKKRLTAECTSIFPFPPIHLRGRQIANQFVSQADVINVINWEAADVGPEAVAFYIYRDPELTRLVAIIPANRELKFRDRNRKPDHIYSYFIVAVDANGIQSPPAGIIFKGAKTQLIKINFAVSIEIVPLKPILIVGSNQQFSAVVTFNDGTVKKLTDVTWNSSNMSIAAINAQGLALGLNPGITTITASFEKVCASAVLTVVAAACPVPVITTLALPTGINGDPYSAAITTVSGVAPLTFSIASGSLPPGLTLDPNTGIISGISTGPGTFNFTVQAASSCGASSTRALSITIDGVCIAPMITTTTLPNGRASAGYSTTITTSGGVAPITFSIVSGSLPSGLTLDPNTGIISGTITATGTFSFTVQATSSCGSSSTRAFSIAINSVCSGTAITTPSPLPSGTVGTAYSVTITTTGGVLPIIFNIGSGSFLPPGLTLNPSPNPSSAIISGTPTTAGTFSFSLLVSNGCGVTFIMSFSITINSA